MRFWMTVVILCGASLLAALDLEYPSGNVYELDYQDYPEGTLHYIETSRSSEGGMVTERWRGISLLKLLEEAGEEGWDVARINSKDNYQTTVNHAELNEQTAYLALYKNGEMLSDYDVRVIFPQGHESTWIRNLKSISMEALQTTPPLQVRSLEILSPMANPERTEAGISMADLVTKVVRLPAAEITLVCKNNRKLRYSFPSKQQMMYLEQGPDKEFYLQDKNRSQPMEKENAILYVQCGNVGFISKGSEKSMPDVALALGWSWLELHKSVHKKKTISGDWDENYLRKLKADTWLELN